MQRMESLLTLFREEKTQFLSSQKKTTRAAKKEGKLNSHKRLTETRLKCGLMLNGAAVVGGTTSHVFCLFSRQDAQAQNKGQPF